MGVRWGGVRSTEAQEEWGGESLGEVTLRQKTTFGLAGTQEGDLGVEGGWGGR